MNCPSVRARNTGSGYVKQTTGEANEMAKKLAELQAARDAQDAKIWATPTQQKPQNQQQK